MTILTVFFQLFISPISLVLESIYGLAYSVMNSVGGAIIPLSLSLNFLLLPLYREADRIQMEEQVIESKMAPGIAHIKASFRGDERYMMLQAYYRLNHYRPIYALRSALPLLLQIPFFIAAYRFLSHLELFNGIPFGVVLDLSKPDKLMELGSLSINLLPILMTLINILSCEIYTKHLSNKEKFQLYAMAGIFFLFLYDSPSGLVIYWTINNLFSLVKNIISTSKNPKQLRVIALSALGILTFLYSILDANLNPLGKMLAMIFAFAFQIPILLYYYRKRHPITEDVYASQKHSSPRVFLLGCIFLAVLTGILIPSEVIHSSPAEFVSVTEYQTPLIHIIYSALTACGFFILWMNIFYYLSSPSAKRYMDALVWIISGCGILNYMLFGTNLGMLTAQLQYESQPFFTDRELIINAEIILLAAAVLTAVWMLRKQFVHAVLPVMLIAVVGISIYNIVEIASEDQNMSHIVKSGRTEISPIKLSHEGNNIVVIMLDRAIGCFVPYLMNEKPDLVQKYDGFVWYPNTLSYGPATNTGSPALYGGYEYIPEELNKRSNESLVEKHNEALKVMPVIFDRAGFKVSVCDPTYAGYTWIPDLSIFNDYPNIYAFRAESGEVGSRYSVAMEVQQNIWQRNFFCYSIMKISPLVLQIVLYQEGTYFNPQRYDGYLQQIQFRHGTTATGLRGDFISSYNVLCALPNMTQILNTDENAFYMMSNSTTHNPMMLQEPDFVPALKVDNTEYEQNNSDRFTVNNRTIQIDEESEFISYQSNMAALIKLGEWFDYLRSEGIFDNTRIIIVADHGAGMRLFEDTYFGSEDYENVISFNPLLMVKDFNAHGFVVNQRFMTNADTPTIAMDRIIDCPVNPFTGKTIDSSPKETGEQHIFYTKIWQTNKNNGTTFLPGSWYAFEGEDIFNIINWKKIGDY